METGTTAVDMPGVEALEGLMQARQKEPSEIPVSPQSSLPSGQVGLPKFLDQATECTQLEVNIEADNSPPVNDGPNAAMLASVGEAEFQLDGVFVFPCTRPHVQEDQDATPSPSLPVENDDLKSAYSNSDSADSLSVGKGVVHDYGETENQSAFAERIDGDEWSDIDVNTPDKVRFGKAHSCDLDASSNNDKVGVSAAAAAAACTTTHDCDEENAMQQALGIELPDISVRAQVPGLVSLDELDIWGPVPWGNLRSRQLGQDGPFDFKFPLLQTSPTSPEPCRAHLKQPMSVVANREAVRRRALVFSPLNALAQEEDGGGASTNGLESSAGVDLRTRMLNELPVVVYDWRDVPNSISDKSVNEAPLPYHTSDRADFEQLRVDIENSGDRDKSLQREGGVQPLNFGMLTFDSHFECGNLLRAVQIGPYEYDLFIRSDINTQTYQQWWYFAITDTHPLGWKELAAARERKERSGPDDSKSAMAALYGTDGSGNSKGPLSLGVDTKGRVTYKFNIVNLCKPDSMYNRGMQPVVYSCQDAENCGQGWRRHGYDVSYYPNQYSRVDSRGSHFTLTFKVRFCNPGDVYMVAHSVPYTWSDNLRHIKHISEKKGVAGDILRRSILCHTLSGRECDLLTITDFRSDDSEIRGRRAVVITGRVHPGETPASWIVKGLLDFLTGPSQGARTLRTMFIFKVIPMLNPDGVFYGNNRCSLAGVDLNRQWQLPSPHRHPTINHAKSLIRQMQASRDVALYVDVHAHSRKNNVFMYGCEEKNRPKPSIRLIPTLVSKSPFGCTMFDVDDCIYHVGKGKETTARVVVSRELQVKCSYTVEATYCGADFGPLSGTQFSIRQFQTVGLGIVDALLQIHHNEAKYRVYATGLLSDLSVQIHGDKRARRALAVEQREREKRKNENVDTGKTLVVDGYTSILPNGTLLTNKFGVITPGWFAQLGLGVGRTTPASADWLKSSMFTYIQYGANIARAVAKLEADQHQRNRRRKSTNKKESRQSINDDAGTGGRQKQGEKVPGRLRRFRYGKRPSSEKKSTQRFKTPDGAVFEEQIFLSASGKRREKAYGVNAKLRLEQDRLAIMKQLSSMEVHGVVSPRSSESPHRVAAMGSSFRSLPSNNNNNNGGKLERQAVGMGSPLGYDGRRSGGEANAKSRKANKGLFAEAIDRRRRRRSSSNGSSSSSSALYSGGPSQVTTRGSSAKKPATGEASILLFEEKLPRGSSTSSTSHSKAKGTTSESSEMQIWRNRKARKVPMTRKSFHPPQSFKKSFAHHKSWRPRNRPGFSRVPPRRSAEKKT